MDRTLLLLTLALVPFAGCLDSSGTGPASPATDSASQAAAQPEPVSIHESIDLEFGEPGRDWSFTVHPGATAAHLRFAVEGSRGTPVAQETNWCFTLTSPRHQASDCGVPAGNVAVSVEVDGSKTFYNWSPAPPGTYTVHFDSAPSIGTFTAYVNIQYA